MVEGIPTTVYTYPDLVKQLYDLERLAIPPVPGERSGNFSSYDRRSVYNEETGCYENWGANNDGDGFIRREGDSIVALEMEGPGVIWRVWSADPREGHIRIVIDHRDEPAIDKPFRDFFETFGHEIANFPNLLPTLSRGTNCFIPIPFQRHCKVFLDKGWGGYYHFTYSLFPAGTEVPYFDGRFDRESALALAEADRVLQLRGRSVHPKDPSLESHKVTVSVPAGGRSVAFSKVGSGAIANMKIRVKEIRDEPEENQRRILRELSLSIKWDQEQAPFVWSPLGDFFGAAPGIQEYRSLPLGMNADHFYCNWFMPFSEGALLEIENDGDETREIALEIEHVHIPKAETDKFMRFHSKWHRGPYLHLDEGRFAEGGDRWPDWPLLLVEGTGRFCGAHLHVYNAWQTPAEQPETWWYGRWHRKTIDWWWGEGDEKFFVDGEAFPSSFGTGSEDYIGYAWAAEPPFPMFESAFACQPFIELDANGHTSVNRFHIGDNVPFTRSFEGFLEKYKADVWDGTNKCLYAATVYWYQFPGGNDPYVPVPLKDRYGFYDL